MTHVLAAVDFSSCSRAALDYAAALARHLSAHLTALHVSPYYPVNAEWVEPPAPPSADPARWQALHEETRALVDGGDAPGRSIVIREGDPAEQIVEWATSNEVDYIVLGTHGRRRLRRLLPGSVTERVARTAACPVIAVPYGSRMELDRVLCAVDLTEDSAETIAHAVAIAHGARAHLILLHTIAAPPPYEPWMIPPCDERTILRTLEDNARGRMARLIVPHAHGGLTLEPRVHVGRPSHEIDQATRAGIALTVLGVRSSRALERFFFGSTARHVLRSAVSPVMLVPHRVHAGAPQEADREATLVAH
jgi:nucleotide-binding universal stress UspA family protein